MIYESFPRWGTSSSRRRRCRISKQVLASPEDTIMVVWLLGPIPNDRSYPDETGGSSHELLVLGAIMLWPQYLTICRGGRLFNTNPCGEMLGLGNSSVVVIAFNDYYYFCGKTYST
ncbi:hypothetical protein AVEN_111220-1 [Araneus ventricosus]|uniref:Uncharacterized protein n=1 Tax=Araneus ventricosus TaxID=182803 RepID=A0A4Y2EM25_ARAVE|nr:hypothetical protein AVEN_111220-1 [Araneus ventricosus]